MMRYVLSNYSIGSLFRLAIEEYIWSIAKHVPGIEGMLLRRLLLRLLAKHCGKNAVIQRSVHIRSGEGFSIGDNFYVNRGCHFDAFGGIDIGNDVGIGPHTTIITNDHQFVTVGNDYSTRQFKGRRVEIGDGTIVGAHCYINPGVRIGKGCVIAAGSAVFVNIPDGLVVGPSPLTMHSKAMRAMIAEFVAPKKSIQEG